MSPEIYTSDFPPLSSLPPGYSESRILIILTGGTICMDPSPSGLTPSPDFLNTHLRPRPTFNCPQPTTGPPLPDLLSYTASSQPIRTPALRTQPSKHLRHTIYTVHELHPLLDSSSISAPAWTRVARTLQRNYALYDGFVVLHGTDSLAYTASALSFMLLNLAKPVVLTGSQVPMAALHSDATDNLIGALACAAHFAVPEVALFFNQRLLRGCRATKTSADAFAAFESPNYGALAEVKATGIQVHWHRVKGGGPAGAEARDRRQFSAPRAPLRIRAHLGTAFVACVRLFPGITAEMLDAVIRVKDLKGLVLETFGAGNAPLGGDGEEGGGGVGDDGEGGEGGAGVATPPVNGSGADGGLMRVLKEAKEREVVVVGVSQCLTGSVSPLYAGGVALVRAGVIPGADLTTEAALTKLAFLFEGGEEEGGIEGQDGTPETPRVKPEDVDWARRTERIREGMTVAMRGEMTV